MDKIAFTEKLGYLKDHELSVTYGMSVWQVANALEVLQGDDTYNRALSQRFCRLGLILNKITRKLYIFCLIIV